MDELKRRTQPVPDDVSISKPGLETVSLSEIKLNVVTLADLDRYYEKKAPTPPPPGGRQLQRDTPRDIFPKNPAREKSLPPPEPPAFALQADVSPDCENKPLYSLAPARCVGDRRLNYTDLRTLLALACYTSVWGIAYPNRATLARRIGIDPTCVSRSMTRLQKFGYVRRLESLGRKLPSAYARGARWQVLIRGNDPLPPKERLWVR